METRDLQHKDLKELAETFGLLADPTRLSIVLACRDQEKPAGDIAAELGVSASLTSHHLRLLRSARIVKSERRGKQILYTMADACVDRVLKIMIDHQFSHHFDHSEEAEPSEEP